MTSIPSPWEFTFVNSFDKTKSLPTDAAGVGQLVSARISEQEVPDSILGDCNVCFDFPLIRVAIALNSLKME